MEIYIYYGAFASLILQCVYGGFLCLGSIIQLILLKRKDSKTGSHHYVFTRIIQGLVTLLVGIILISILQANLFSPWIPMVAGWIYMAVEHLIDQYHIKRWVF